ncbi:hypothetical protein RCL1_005948 [Eukaryota sp. TZLM3-RCL]
MLLDDNDLGGLFFDNDLLLETVKAGPYTLNFHAFHQENSHVGGLTGHIIWSGANELSNFIVSNSSLFSSSAVIELGSGTGVSGLFASLFSPFTILTDYSSDILDRIQGNYEINKSFIPPNHKVIISKLDWTQALDLLSIQQHLSSYSDLGRIVIGSDVIYHHGETKSLARNISELLRPQDEAILVNLSIRYNPNRAAFLDHCREYNLTVKEREEGDFVWLRISR